MGEREAIRRLKQSNIDGLEYLVLKYQVQAMQAAYLVCRDRALAEDIVQSAFITAYECIGGFDETRSFGPWFLRSVVNSALKASMKRSRTVSLESSLPHGVTSLAHEGAGLEERIESLETSAAISAAISQLPPKQRSHNRLFATHRLISGN
ncbi:MAG: sigma-70 family RNA polymerase sigma factor [Chloroflexota bacterium]|nr:sigma-70 family RNA polymerase sigma factor [Chloroflexota bacterium]